MAANAHTVNILARGHFVAASFLIVAVAALLRFHHLGTEELWLDEAVSAHMVVSDWASRFLPDDNTPPLYYLLLKLWGLLVGDGEFSLRSLSALAGSLFVLATIWMGKEVFDESVGLWSGLFVAVNPIAIYYSQEVRAYSLLLLLLILAFVNFWLALREGAFKNWFLFSLCAALALYAHYLAPLALAPTLVLLLVWPVEERRGHPWRNYAFSVAVCAMLFSPMLVAKFLYAGEIIGVLWVERMWGYGSPWLLVPQSFEVFGLGAQSGGVTLIRLKQMTAVDLPAFFRVLGLALLAMLAVAAIIPWGDRTLGIPWLGRRKVWLISLVCLPLLLLLGISLVQPVYVVGRYDLIGFPAYSILLGLGAAKLQRVTRHGPLIAYPVALCVVGIMSTKLFFYYGTSAPADRSNARATASFVSSNAKNGDVVVFTGLRGAPVIYYLRRLGYDWRSGRCLHEDGGRYFGCRIFPRKTESHMGAYVPAGSLDEIAREAKNLVEELKDENSSFLVVLGKGRVIEGDVSFSEDDYLLMKELAALGHSKVRSNATLSVLNLRKPAPANQE